MQRLMHFISYIDLVALRFLPLWEMLRPRTPMGERHKEECRPYRTEEKELWERDMQQLQQLVALTRDQEQYALYVKGIEDLTPMLCAWQKGEEPKRIDWFHVQQFLQKGWRVLTLPNWDNLWDRFPKYAQNRWRELLQLFSPNHKRPTLDDASFHFEELFPDLFQPLQFEQRRLESERTELLIERKTRIEQELGFAIGRKRPFYIARKEQEQIHRLKQHPAFVVVKETPFDVAFDWTVDEHEDQLQQRIEALEMKWQEAEREANAQLAAQVLPYREELLQWVTAFGELDFMYAKACLAESYNGVMPIWDDTSTTFTMSGGVHPWLQSQWGSREESFTPIDIELSEGEVAVIVGPNMGGKSVAIKTVGLCTLMAMLGLFVPAANFRFAPIDGIVYIGGEQEQLEVGLSSFGGEVQQLKHLLQRGDEERLLVLCDEVGRGTNPEEGEALAISIVEELGVKPWYTCFVSHYSAVVDLPNISIYQIRGLPKFEEDGGGRGLGDSSREMLHASTDLLRRLDHRLERVERGVVPQTALRIAEWLGMPSEVVERAKQVLGRKKKGEEQHE